MDSAEVSNNEEINSSIQEKEDRYSKKGRKGIRTKSTIKDNNYDKKFENGGYISYNGEPLPYSLNKKKRWEEIEKFKKDIEESKENEELLQELKVKEVVETKIHSQICELSYKPLGQPIPRKSYSGGWFIKQRTGRNFKNVQRTICPTCGNPELSNGEKDLIVDTENQKNQNETNSSQANPNSNSPSKINVDIVFSPGSNMTVSKFNSLEDQTEEEEKESEIESILVQLPFDKGSYPLYRETRWSYSTPCMCCFHRDVIKFFSQLYAINQDF